MQAHSFYQNPIISRLLISFLTVIAIILICLLAHQVYQMISYMLSIFRHELSNMAVQSLYLR